jgi:hypothetical protein
MTMHTADRLRKSLPAKDSVSIKELCERIPL